MQKKKKTVEMGGMGICDVSLWSLHLYLIQGDPSLRGGNGIPSRCVFLEEMAAELDGQDWLDMDSIEQVSAIVEDTND